MSIFPEKDMVKKLNREDLEFIAVAGIIGLTAAQDIARRIDLEKAPIAGCVLQLLDEAILQTNKILEPPGNEMNDLAIIWYHPATNTIFQWGHLEVMFHNLMSPRSGHIKGIAFSSWDDFEPVGLL